MRNRVMAGVLALAVSTMGVSGAGAFSLFGSDDSQPRRQEKSAVVLAQAGTPRCGCSNWKNSFGSSMGASKK